MLCAVSAVAVLSAAVNLLAGGYSFHLGPFRFASHSFFRDLAVAALSAIGAVAVWGRDAILPEAGFDRLRRALLSSGFLQRAVPFAECVDNRFAKKAAGRP